MCTPCSESMRSLSCPTCRENAAESKDGPNFCSFLPGFTQPRSPARSPATWDVVHSESSRHRCVNAFAQFLVSTSHSSSTARSIRSASPRVRLTCLFRTLSVVLLLSLCFTRMCRRRTCEGVSVFRLLAADAAALPELPPAGSRPSKKATTEPRPMSLPTAPSHCTAASVRAPEAMRGLPWLRRNTVDTAVPRPMALYSARHTSAMPLCLWSR
mmetsp:Transcript_98713/g.279314  ORF Transcript_98713/g.279314 Transcript_98713/m.279314 type:complete len:213 (+) Transcript_98713:55-693(+)